jgi:hypothetical protein
MPVLKSLAFTAMPKSINDKAPYFENPHRNGLFGAGLEIYGLEGLDGGAYRDRTCDPST